MPPPSIFTRLRTFLRAHMPAPAEPAKPVYRLDNVPVDRPEEDPVDPRDPVAYAVQIVEELEQLKAVCREKGREDLVERLEYEINGYPSASDRYCEVDFNPPEPEIAVFSIEAMQGNGPARYSPPVIPLPGGIPAPSYRAIDSELRGEISSRDGSRRLPLPFPVARARPWHTSLGLRRVQEIPGLVEALREGKAFFTIPQDPPDHDVRREFAAKFPDSGYSLTRTWHRVPVANVHKLADKVARYSRDMVAAADNKPSWW